MNFLDGHPFCLSLEEAEKYFSSDFDRICEPTSYALHQIEDIWFDGAGCEWWLRSPGAGSTDAATVTLSGKISNSGCTVIVQTNSMRPAIWVNLPDQGEARPQPGDASSAPVAAAGDTDSASANTPGGASQKQNLAGVWDIQNVDELLEQSMADSDEELPDEVKSLAAEIFPDICFMNINADGTFQLVAMAETVDGTWEYNGDELTLTAEGEPIVGKLDGTTFTLEEGGMKMVFAKTGDAPRKIPTEEELQSKLMELALSLME